MSTLRFWIPALLAAGGALLAIPAGPIIGVVDLAKAFELYPKAIEMRKDLKKIEDDYRGKLQEIRKKIDEMTELIKILGEGSEELKQRQFDRDVLVQVHKFQATRFDESLRLADMRMQAATYEDMEIAVAKVAKNRGVQLVMRTYNPGPLSDLDKAAPKDVHQRLDMFDRRQVWFATDEIDLTGDLIKLLLVPLEKDALPVAPKTEARKQAKPERRGE